MARLALVLIIATLSFTAQAADWTVKGKVRVQHQLTQMGANSGHISAVSGAKVRVQAKTSLGTYKSWTSSGYVTGTNGSFSVTKDPLLGGDHRKIRVQVKFESDRLKIGDGRNVIGTAWQLLQFWGAADLSFDWEDLFKADWITIYEEEWDRPSDGQIDLGNLMFSSGASQELNDVYARRHAEMWVVYTLLLDWLESKGMPFLSTLHITHPVPGILSQDVSYSDPLLTHDTVMFLDSDWNPSTTALPTLLHEAMHIWTYDHTTGEYTLFREILQDGDTHCVEDDREVLFHEAVSGFLELALQHELALVDPDPLPLPYNRAALNTGFQFRLFEGGQWLFYCAPQSLTHIENTLSSTNNMQHNEFGWMSFFRTLTTQGLGGYDFLEEGDSYSDEFVVPISSNVEFECPVLTVAEFLDAIIDLDLDDISFEAFLDRLVEKGDLTEEEAVYYLPLVDPGGTLQPWEWCPPPSVDLVVNASLAGPVAYASTSTGQGWSGSQIIYRQLTYEVIVTNQSWEYSLPSALNVYVDDLWSDGEFTKVQTINVPELYQHQSFSTNVTVDVPFHLSGALNLSFEVEVPEPLTDSFEGNNTCSFVLEEDFFRPDYQIEIVGVETQSDTTADSSSGGILIFHEPQIFFDCQVVNRGPVAAESSCIVRAGSATNETEVGALSSLGIPDITVPALDSFASHSFRIGTDREFQIGGITYWVQVDGDEDVAESRYIKNGVEFDGELYNTAYYSEGIPLWILNILADDLVEWIDTHTPDEVLIDPPEWLVDFRPVDEQILPFDWTQVYVPGPFDPTPDDLPYNLARLDAMLDTLDYGIIYDTRGTYFLSQIKPVPELSLAEPFDYTAGSALPVEGWSTAGPAGLTPVILSGDLTTSGTISPEGSRLQILSGVGPSARMSLGNQLKNGSVYFSALMRVEDQLGLLGNGVSLMGFDPEAGFQAETPEFLGAQVLLRATSGGFNVGLTKSESVNLPPQDPIWDNQVFSTNDTLFLVGQYVFQANSPSNDVVQLWVWPASQQGAFEVPPAPHLSSSNGTDFLALNSFTILQRFGSGQPASLWLDDLRVGTSWQEVAAPANQMDFGDAPDPSFPTLALHNGARHRTGALRLGQEVDAETNGIPTIQADGDDLDGVPTDEDGVVFPALPVIPGSTEPVTVIVSGGPGFLNAWMDFDRDGFWRTNEQIFTDLLLTNGVHSLTFPVPSTATPSLALARFRISESPGSRPRGYAASGEVEDYRVPIGSQIDLVAELEPLGIEIREGNPVPCRATVLNAGPSTATNVQFSVTFSGPASAGLTLGGVDTTRGTCTVQTGEVTCAVSRLPANQSAVVDMLLVPQVSGSLTCTVTAATLLNEADPADNQASMTLPVVQRLDFGDAPDPGFPTLLARNGARHRIVSGWYLGQGVDSEVNGQPSSTAIGDDANGAPNDEDGVLWPVGLGRGVGIAVPLIASTNGAVDAWVDFDHDQQWEAPEKVIDAAVVTPGLNTLFVSVPPVAPSGQTFARVRFSAQGGLAPVGFASEGEVEDYQITVHPGVDLGVTITPQASEADEGFPLFLTLTVSNRGPATATGVTLTHEILSPAVAATIEMALSNDGACTVVSNGLLCALSPLLPGASAEVLVEILPSVAGQITNQTTVTSAEVDLQPMDNTFTLISLVQTRFDFGDAPSPAYGTTLADDGARHRLRPGWKLGSFLDAESDGLASADATGDDATGEINDEDGVEFQSPLISGQEAIVRVLASTGGLLDAWIDYNGDGDWDPEERVFDHTPVGPGPKRLSFLVPVEAMTGQTFARFRFSESGVASPNGEAPQGEVEDYAVQILPAVDLKLTASAVPPFQFEGQVELSSWSVTNAGPHDATNVSLVVGIPDALNVISISNTLGMWIDQGSNVVCFVPSLPAQQTFRLDILLGEGSLEGGQEGEEVVAYPLWAVTEGETPDVLLSDNLARVDAQVFIARDFGDAPASYGTLEIDNGARHGVVPGLHLGASLDAEADGQPSVLANQETTDDGVVWTLPLSPGTTASVLTSASTNGLLHAWIDFNQDGDWNDPEEQIFANELIGPSETTLGFWVPSTSVSGQTYARFRFSSEGFLSPLGFSPDGEVEDYAVTIDSGETHSPLSIQWSGDQFTLTWNGSNAVLEAASVVAGPWTEVTGATSPMPIDTDLLQQFFRLRFTNP